MRVKNYGDAEVLLRIHEGSRNAIMRHGKVDQNNFQKPFVCTKCWGRRQLEYRQMVGSTTYSLQFDCRGDGSACRDCDDY